MTFSIARSRRWWESVDAVAVDQARNDESLTDALLSQIRSVSGPQPSGRLSSDESANESADRAEDSSPMSELEALPTAGALAAGYLGFEPTARPIFHVAASLRESDVPAAAPNVEIVAHEQFPTARDYEKLVRKALAALTSDTSFRKVVLGRWLDLRASEPLAARSLAATLARIGPATTVMRLPSLDPRSESGGPNHADLVTATPELLIAKRGLRILSRPLAGSAVRHADPDKDRRRAKTLAHDSKNRYEHQLVVEAIAETLGPLCASLRVPNQPDLVGTDAMWHLATPIAGTLREDIPVARIAQLLHPTPAVAGTPTARATDLIATLEPAARGPMTGAAGWMDAEGNGEFHVVIRAALVSETLVRLFAGAGLVPGSEPASESAETGAKLTTVLRALDQDESRLTH